jgi:hypothetical protein
MGKKYTEDMLWPEWTDVVGNTYRPGDLVAIAIINGRSPQMVLAKVIRINKVNSYGEPHMANKVFKLDEPVRHERECYVQKRKNDPYYVRYYGERDSTHICSPSCTEYWQTEETRKVPSCTVTAEPVLDCRGFGRWSTDQDGKNKPVTYSIPENILFVEKGS